MSEVDWVRVNMEELQRIVKQQADRIVILETELARLKSLLDIRDVGTDGGGTSHSSEM